MAFNSVITRGPATTTNADPYQLKEHLDEKLRTVSPDATPLVTLSQYAMRGPKPRSHKVIQMEFDEFDHFDFCSQAQSGATLVSSGGYGRFARLKLDQPSRPWTNSDMYYDPQDILFIQKTGQNLEIVMTPTSSKWMGDDPSTALTLPQTLATGTGSDTVKVSTCTPGYVVVRVVEDEPFRTFTKSDVIYLGRTIKESQDIGRSSHQAHPIYNCNFVEHKETTFTMSEDMRNMVDTREAATWEFQVEQLARNFKKTIEYNFMWGHRKVDFTQNRATRYMGGLFDAIRTNVATYNPSTITDFEEFFMNFTTDMAFATTPNGNKKIMIAGARLLQRFNRAFKDYRRMTDQVPTGKIGINLDTYVIPGGFELKIIRSDMLRMNTGFEDWGFVIDPKEIEVMVNKNFETKAWQDPGERDYHLMIEWQGTIAWHREQVHALLRTT